MVTSAYDNDDRVRQVDDYLYIVSAPDDRYFVDADRPSDWWISPRVGGTSSRAASIRSREEAEAWAARTTRGPFRSADEAIRELIGDPR